MEEALLESLLFVRGEDGMTIEEMKQYTNVTLEALRDWQRRLEEDDSRGIQLNQYGDHFKLVTKKQYHEAIERLVAERPKASLSRAALEALAIIAYRQPITKAEIDDIRGVSSDASVQRLLERQLIEERGRLEQVGRPIVYGTTATFLEQFGLASLEDLPSLKTTDTTDEHADLFMSQFKEVFS